MNSVKCIVWDWNGTLLDDVHVNIRTINTLLTARGLASIPSLEVYRDGFGFPIIDYYRTLGFDTERERFSDIAEEYVQVYNVLRPEATVSEETKRTLRAVRDLGIRQVIVSAAETLRLRDEVKSYGIAEYFTDMLGTANNLGSSKREVARTFVAESGFSPDEVVFIGDIEHDAEVAEAAGCRCILVSSGHQSAERLRKTGCTVIPGTDKVTETLFGA